MNLLGQFIETTPKLRGHHKLILSIFYENSNLAFSPSQLFKILGNQLHQNTVSNFIKSAKMRGWIVELKPIQGSRISNAYVDYKEPDFLPTGQKVYGKRNKYYRISKEGIRIYESN